MIIEVSPTETRIAIATLQSKLHELNFAYPNERLKKAALRNPEYQAMRTPLIGLCRDLSWKQNYRRIQRKILSQS